MGSSSLFSLLTECKKEQMVANEKLHHSQVMRVFGKLFIIPAPQEPLYPV